MRKCERRGPRAELMTPSTFAVAAAAAAATTTAYFRSAPLRVFCRHSSSPPVAAAAVGIHSKRRARANHAPTCRRCWLPPPLALLTAFAPRSTERSRSFLFVRSLACSLVCLLCAPSADARRTTCCWLKRSRKKRKHNKKTAHKRTYVS